MPRHQTLRATLDWSYELLPEPERAVLRRLAIFAGAFGLEAARAVVASAEVAPSEVVDGLSNLVAKSLVAADVDGRIKRYRLLDTTRAYAVEKLCESGERDRLARRHAEYYRDAFEQAETESETRPRAEWLADHGRRIDNLRAALDWAFSPGGDASIGVALTAAAVPLWMQLSLLDECRGGVNWALSALAAGANRDARREMKLHAAQGASLMYTRSVTDPEVGAACTKALEIAERLDDIEYQLRALWGVWSFQMRGGQHRVTLALAQRFCSLAANRPDPSDRLIGERMMAESEYLVGNLLGARGQFEHMVSRYTASNRWSHIVRFQIDQRARALLARILWLQGFPDQAMRTAQSSVDDARETDHAISLCYDLALGACPVTLLMGDLGAADHYVGMLLDRSRRHALVLWQAWGRYYQGVLVIKRSGLINGLRLLRTGLDELGEAKFAVRFVPYLGEVAEALGRAGQIADGLGLVEEAVARFKHPEDSWLITDLLRSQGELLLLQGACAAEAAAEDQFRQALDWARQRGALSWELRAATSLARLLRDQGGPADARALIQPVYDRFTEGFDTADLKAAKAFLDALAEPAGLQTRDS